MEKSPLKSIISKSRNLQFNLVFIGQLTRWHDWNHCKWKWSKYLENHGNKTTSKRLFYWWMPYLMTHYSVITWQLSSLMRAEVHQSKRVPLSYFSTQYSNSFFVFKEGTTAKGSSHVFLDLWDNDFLIMLCSRTTDFLLLL